MRQIIHLDLDCFFVSVERLTRPELRGIPVVVGGSPQGRGVVASASYEARTFGVHSAMPTTLALRKCPDLKIISSHVGEYSRYSGLVLAILKEYTPLVEPASIDEMYCDVTRSGSMIGADLPAYLRRLQKRVADDLGLPCSIGAGVNKHVAKIATETAKPGGTRFVPEGAERDFLAPLPIELIAGVGKKTAETLHARGFKTIGELQDAGAGTLTAILGNPGIWLYEAAIGGGSDEIVVDRERKSVSREETFDSDIEGAAAIENRLFPLVEDVCSTVRRKTLKAKCVTLKLRYSDFSTVLRSVTGSPTSDDGVVLKRLRTLLHSAYKKGRGIRLVGVRLSEFIIAEEEPQSLFPESAKRDAALNAVDKIRKKFGDDAIHTGSV